MFTVAVLYQPTPANEYTNSHRLGRRVVLFAGTRGNVARFDADRCLFTIAKSGARYIVDLDRIVFEAADTTGEFAPKPAEGI